MSGTDGNHVFMIISSETIRRYSESGIISVTTLQTGKGEKWEQRIEEKP